MKKGISQITRENIATYNNRRLKFQGIFVRTGVSVKGSEASNKTVLLRNIVDVENNIKIDHIWVNHNSQFQGIKFLKEGDTIEFTAKVKKYKKGWVEKYKKGEKYNDYKKFEIEDYQLSKIRNIKIVNFSKRKPFPIKIILIDKINLKTILTINKVFYMCDFPNFKLKKFIIIYNLVPLLTGKTFYEPTDKTFLTYEDLKDYLLVLNKKRKEMHNIKKECKKTKDSKYIYNKIIGEIVLQNPTLQISDFENNSEPEEITLIENVKLGTWKIVSDKVFDESLDKFLNKTITIIHKSYYNQINHLSFKEQDNEIYIYTGICSIFDFLEHNKSTSFNIKEEFNKIIGSESCEYLSLENKNPYGILLLSGAGDDEYKYAIAFDNEKIIAIQIYFITED